MSRRPSYKRSHLRPQPQARSSHWGQCSTRGLVSTCACSGRQACSSSVSGHRPSSTSSPPAWSLEAVHLSSPSLVTLAHPICPRETARTCNPPSCNSSSKRRPALLSWLPRYCRRRGNGRVWADRILTHVRGLCAEEGGWKSRLERWVRHRRGGRRGCAGRAGCRGSLLLLLLLPGLGLLRLACHKYARAGGSVT